MVNKKKPARTCIACGSQKEKNELLRIVRTPEGNIEDDIKEKKNRKGEDICKREDNLNKNNITKNK